ncbi:hypothetical protein BDV93DRAFT_571914 [Ceratobasidium sp. AG-I]|nr:hypothetical protein BDV93DRAFT_571914 [Ceratobasidium sp. AG-I]
MSPAPDQTSQLAPSQFAHFKTVEPLTTASGIAPGRALLDPPSPNHSTPVLEQKQRARKPSARKAEASQVQTSTSKSKGKQAIKSTPKKPSRKNVGNTTSTRTSDTVQGDHSNSGDEGDESDKDNKENNEVESETQGIDQTIIDWSRGRIRALLDAIPATQTLAMETQAELSSTIAKSPAGVGLESGDRDAYDSHEAGERSGTATEDESEGDSNAPHRPRTSPSDSDPDSDSDSDTKSCPTMVSQLRHPPAGASGGKAPKTAYSKQPLRTRPSNPSSRLPAFPSANPSPLTSSNNSAATLRQPPNTSAFLARHPPPANLNDLNALTVWALQIAKEQEQAQALGNTSNSRSQQPDQPNTTTNHILRAIPSHRSPSNGTVHPSPQVTSSSQSQSTSANPSSFGATIPQGDNTPATGTDTVPSHHKKSKCSKKASLGDFPGPPGQVASAAIPYFLATVFAEGAYENIEVFRDWALDAYDCTWTLEVPESEYEAPPKALLVIMTRRVSWLRGDVKKRIRVIVQYGFDFKNPAVTRAEIKHNRQLVKKLSPSAFHCQDLLPTTAFKHPEFICAIGAGLFWDPESLGVVFRDRFKVVPIPAHLVNTKKLRSTM